MSKPHKVGPFTIRPKVVNGIDTGKWVLDIPESLTSNGKRKRKLFETRKSAIDVARELRRRIDPVTGQPVVQTKRSGFTLREAIKGWYQDERLRVDTLKKRASTLEVDLYRLRNLLAYFGKDDLGSVTEKRITGYQSYRLDQGRQAVTINSETALLTRIMGWARKQGYIELHHILVPLRVTSGRTAPPS